MLVQNNRIYLLTQFLHSLIFTIPIWIAYYQGFLNPVQIATIVGFQYALQVVMELPSGALADILGRKKSLAFGFGLGAASLLLFPLATDFWHFLALAALGGASDSFRSGSEEALIYDTHKQENSDGFEKLYSHGNLIYQAGLIIGTLTGGFLYQVHIFLPYILYGVSLVIGMIASLFYIEPKIDSAKFTLQNYIRQINQGFRESFKDRLTTLTSLYYIAVGGITWTNALFFCTYFILGLGFTDGENGLIQGSARLINALLITYVISRIKLSDRFKVLIFPVIMLAGFLPGAFVTGWAGVPFAEIAMLSGTLRWVLLTPLTNKVFSSNVRATAISSLSLLIGIVYVVIVTISGPVIDTRGIGTMYTLIGLISLVTVVPLAYLLNREMGRQASVQS